MYRLVIADKHIESAYDALNGGFHSSVANPVYFALKDRIHTVLCADPDDMQIEFSDREDHPMGVDVRIFLMTFIGATQTIAKPRAVSKEDFVNIINWHTRKRGLRCNIYQAT